MRPTRIRELKMKIIFGILVAVICFGDKADAQIKRKSKFLIEIENTAYGIFITGVKGCGFSYIEFGLNEGQIQEFDRFGMRSNDSNRISSFRISIKKTKDGIILEGIEGTKWKELSYTCPTGCRQLVNQNRLRKRLFL